MQKKLPYNFQATWIENLREIEFFKEPMFIIFPLFFLIERSQNRKLDLTLF